MYKILHTGHHGYSFWIVTLLRTLIHAVFGIINRTVVTHTVRLFIIRVILQKTTDE